MLFIYFSQCDQLCEVSKGEMTLHNLCHHWGCTPDNVRRHLAKFIPRHSQWIRHVGHNYFQKKRIDPMEYFLQLITEDFQYDLLAIFIFAQMFYVHVKVISSKGAWVTNRRNLNSGHEIILVFFGGLTFHDMCIVQGNVPAPISWYTKERNSGNVLKDRYVKTEWNATVLGDNNDDVKHESVNSDNLICKNEMDMFRVKEEMVDEAVVSADVLKDDAVTDLVHESPSWILHHLVLVLEAMMLLLRTQI